MDLKTPGNQLFVIGETNNEFGGSHFCLANKISGGDVPQVDVQRAKATFAALHQTIQSGHVRSCHDLSEGGLAVAVAEMAFAGGCGIHLHLNQVPHTLKLKKTQESITALLFSESNTRFVCEVAPESVDSFTAAFAGIPVACIGSVEEEKQLVVDFEAENGTHYPVLNESIETLKQAWQSPLRWS